MLDSDGDGQIDYDEFLSATVDHAQLLNKQNFTSIFKIFDKNGDGKISIEEL